MLEYPLTKKWAPNIAMKLGPVCITKKRIEHAAKNVGVPVAKHCMIGKHDGTVQTALLSLTADKVSALRKLICNDQNMQRAHVFGDE